MIPKLCGLQLKTSALRKACLCDYNWIRNVAYLETIFGIWTCLSFAHSVKREPWNISALLLVCIFCRYAVGPPGVILTTGRQSQRESTWDAAEEAPPPEPEKAGEPAADCTVHCRHRSTDIGAPPGQERWENRWLWRKRTSSFLDTSEGYRIQLKGYEMNRIPCSWYDRWLTSTIKWETRMSQLLNCHEFLRKKPKTFTVSKGWPPVTLMTFSSRSSADSEHISANGHTLMALSSSNLLLFHRPPARILQVRWHRPSRI